MLVVVVEESLGPEMGRDVDAGMEGAVVWVVAQMLAVGAEAGAGAGAEAGAGEMAQMIIREMAKSPVALAEDLSLLPSTNMVAPSQSWN